MFGTVKKALLISEIYRIKRFLLVYHNFRYNKLEDQFWLMGGNLKPEIKKNLSE
jgi:hypothetical protein